MLDIIVQSMPFYVGFFRPVADTQCPNRWRTDQPIIQMSFCDQWLVTGGPSFTNRKTGQSFYLCYIKENKGNQPYGAVCMVASE